MRSSLFYFATQTMVCTTLLVAVSACTKSNAKKQASSEDLHPITAPPQTPALPNPAGTAEAVRPLYSIASLGGEELFCQNFSAERAYDAADLEPALNRMAGAQAGIPEGLMNPFTLQTLALKLNPSGCKKTPELLKGGHCALSVVKQLPSGAVTLQTEQRLFWKDIPTLAQASSAKATLDTKAGLLSSKNALFASLQTQINQQKLLLQILEKTSGGSALFTEAQNLLTALQEQAATLSNETKDLEEQIAPLQNELNKRTEELQTARAALKMSCNPSGMGAVSAVWKDAD